MNDSQLTGFRTSLRRIERFLFTNLKEDGKCCGVTFNECHILMEMIGNNEIVMADLTQNLEMDKSIISRSIDLMVTTGLVQRKENTEDRRKKSIMLTESGENKARAINAYVNKKYLMLFANMTKDEEESIVSSVKLLASVFDKWKESESDLCKGEMNGCYC